MSITTTDPIADLLSRLRNATAMNKAQLQVPHSKLKLSLLNILKAEGYLISARVTKGVKPVITVVLADDEQNLKPLRGLKKISKPGRRVYVKSHEIPVVRQGRGIAIVSTPQGLMVGHKAKARKLGGELLCEIW